MQQTARMSSVKVLVECALAIALSMVLSYIKVWEMPFGGSVTALSMLPIAIIGYKHGLKWGLISGVAYGLMQLMFQANYLVGISLTAVGVAVVFDYLLAFGSLGLSGTFKGQKNGFQLGVAFALFMRFVCHFIVGVFIWAPFADMVVEGMNPYIYSLIYNGTYMLPELVITLIASILIQKTALNRIIEAK